MIRKYSHYNRQPQEVLGINTELGLENATVWTATNREILFLSGGRYVPAKSIGNTGEFGPQAGVYATRWTSNTDSGDTYTAPVFSSNEGCTVLVVAEISSDPTQNIGYANQWEYGAGPYNGYRFLWDRTTSRMTLMATDTSAITKTVSTYFGGFKTGMQCWVAANGLNDGFIYNGGVEQTLAIDERLISATYAYLAKPFYVGREAQSFTYANRPMALVMVVPQVISRPLAKELSINPWQLFAPRSIWVPNAEAFASSRFNKPLRVPSVRTTQPQGTENINFSDTLTNGLVCLVNGATLRDHVSGNLCSVVNSTGSSTSVNGRSLLFSGTQYLSTPITNINGKDHTIIGVGRINSLAAARVIASMGYSGSAPQDNILFVDTAGSAYAFDRATSYGQAISPVGSIEINKTYVLAAVTKGTSSRTIYRNGVALATDTAVVPLPTFIDTFYVGIFRTSATFYYQHSGDVYLAALYNRALSPEEIEQISANPWQLFAPQEKFIQTAYTPKAPWSVTKSRMLGTGTGAPAQVVPNRQPKVIVRTSQPDKPERLDFQNPITKGLIFAWSGLDPDGQFGRKYFVPSNTSEGLTPIIGPYGKGAYAPQRYASRNYKLGQDVPPPMTFLSVFSDYNNRNLDRRMITGMNSNTNVGYAFDLYTNTNNTITAIGYNTTPAGFMVTSTSVTKAIGLNVCGGAISASGLVQVYMQGVSEGSVQITGTPQGLSSNTNDGVIAIGNRAFFGMFNGGSFSPFYLNLFWDRELTPGEMKSMANNPWQIFAPTSRSIWSNV